MLPSFPLSNSKKLKSTPRIFSNAYVPALYRGHAAGTFPHIARAALLMIDAYLLAAVCAHLPLGNLWGQRKCMAVKSWNIMVVKAQAEGPFSREERACRFKSIDTLRKTVGVSSSGSWTMVPACWGPTLCFESGARPFPYACVGLSPTQEVWTSPSVVAACFVGTRTLSKFILTPKL